MSILYHFQYISIAVTQATFSSVLHENYQPIVDSLRCVDWWLVSQSIDNDLVD